jgi:hypothetical protein
MGIRPLLFALLALPPAAPAAAQDVDQVKIDEAIQKGAEFLLKKYAKGFNENAWNSSLELVMLSLSHAKVSAEDEAFQKGLKNLESTKLQYTYRVAALAMAFQRIDPKKYQDRIAHCAQWLVDTQLPEGEWGYPDTLKAADEQPKPVEVDAPKLPKADKKDDKPGSSQAAIVIKRSPITRTLNLKSRGDISNAQFAVLGLKACSDAGIEIPKATWEAALRYFLTTQNQDGGWGYYFNGMKDKSYASMTSAGVCSVAICRAGLRQHDPQKDKSVQAGLIWLGQNFKADDNANATKSHVADPTRWLYYYLYSIERAGRIAGVDEIGKQKWYPVGAKYLLQQQKADGSWWTGIPGEQWKQAGDIETADTCFAILFLTKATPPLTISEDTRKK